MSTDVPASGTYSEHIRNHTKCRALEIYIGLYGATGTVVETFIRLNYGF